jgi:hypothetical protein
MIACQDDQSNNASSNESKINGEISCQCNEDSASLSNVGTLIRSFSGARSTSWVLATSSEPCNPPCDNHHPEQSELVFPVGGSSEYNTQDKENSSKDNASSPSKAVNRDTEKEHSENLTNQVRVRETGLDDFGNSFWIAASPLVSVLISFNSM